MPTKLDLGGLLTQLTPRASDSSQLGYDGAVRKLLEWGGLLLESGLLPLFRMILLFVVLFLRYLAFLLPLADLRLILA